MNTGLSDRSRSNAVAPFNRIHALRLCVSSGSATPLVVHAPGRTDGEDTAGPPQQASMDVLPDERRFGVILSVSRKEPFHGQP